MSSTLEKFLEGKLRQAESDVAMYALMLDELRKLQIRTDSQDRTVKFLKVVSTTKQEEN